MYESVAVNNETPCADVPCDEGVNQLTHGIGLVLSLAGAGNLLANLSPSFHLQLGAWVYVIALVGLFMASFLSHSFITDPHRTRWRTIDQIAIFGVIAGTYTPVGLSIGAGWWNVPLVLVWLAAGIGVYLKLKITRTEMVPVWFYVIVATIPLLALPRIFETFGSRGMAWIIAGGVCYVLGVIFLINDRKVQYFHAVWHILVILGSVCHYMVINNYALA